MSSIAPALDFRLKSILVATDLSETSEKSLQHALAIARHYGAKLYLVNVVSSLGFTLAGADALNVATEATWRDAHQWENRLVRTGALAGLRHELVVRQGSVWEVLNQVVRQEHVDLIVCGTHGWRGLRKVLLGSIAEQIFRYADCTVFTVGPDSYQESRVDHVPSNRRFLFPTDFGEASLHGLAYAISYANELQAQLVLLHVVHGNPRPKSYLHMASLRRLGELTLNSTLKLRPEFLVEYCPAGPVSEKILKTAEKLKVDLIMMGLRRSTYVEAASHAPWTTAYEVVCGAGCPVLTIRR